MLNVFPLHMFVWYELIHERCAREHENFVSWGVKEVNFITVISIKSEVETENFALTLRSVHKP